MVLSPVGEPMENAKSLFEVVMAHAEVVDGEH